MCGRYVSASTPDDIASYFDAEAPVEERALPPSWNVAPTDDVYVVRFRSDGTRVVAPHHWGLVPFWAKSPATGGKMINARAEGIAEKGAFKASFRAKRCLVPADGFYEWDKVSGQTVKQPYFVHRPDDEPLAFAGLWASWSADRSGDERLLSTSIITTTPNGPMAAIHDRMPVVLPPSAWDEWLDPENHDVDALASLLVPAPDDLLVLRPVGREVGNVRNQGPQLIEEVDPLQPVVDPDAPPQLPLGHG